MALRGKRVASLSKAAAPKGKRSRRRTPIDPKFTSPETIVNRDLVARGRRVHPTRAALGLISETVYLREIESCRHAFQAGNLGALVSALITCRQREVERYIAPEPSALLGGEPIDPAADDFWMEIPTWIWDAATRIVRDHVRTASLGKTGRAARWLQQSRNDMADYERWMAVNEVRAQGVVFTDDAVWLEAAQVLRSKREGTTKVGLSPSAVKKGYARVQSRIQDEPFRYKQLMNIGSLKS
jgi:hypothetical protein